MQQDENDLTRQKIGKNTLNKNDLRQKKENV